MTAVRYVRAGFETVQRAIGLQRADLGLLVIALLWVAIVANIVAFYRVSRNAAALVGPYLGWVSFALVLNYAIYAAAG